MPTSLQLVDADAKIGAHCGSATTRASSPCLSMLLSQHCSHGRGMRSRQPSARSWLVTCGPMSATTLLTRSKDHVPLNFPKTGQNYLGGCAAKGSDLHERVTRLNISNMQRWVLRTLQEYAERDPLGETSSQLQNHMTQHKVPPTEMHASLDVLSNWKGVVADVVARSSKPRTDCSRSKFTFAGCGRQSERRNAIRETLPEGYHIGVSAKRSVRTAHKLRACSMIPQVDYQDHSYSGLEMPGRSGFDVICKLYSKSKLVPNADSSGSDTSPQRVKMADRSTLHGDSRGNVTKRNAQPGECRRVLRERLWSQTFQKRTQLIGECHVSCWDGLVLYPSISVTTQEGGTETDKKYSVMSIVVCIRFQNRSCWLPLPPSACLRCLAASVTAAVARHRQGSA